MGRIRAQITTRSGPPGIKDAPTVPHGDWTMDGARPGREFIETLQGCLEAARGVAADGMVTEVSVLVYPELVGRNGKRGQR